jgi:hypothetical protein
MGNAAPAAGADRRRLTRPLVSAEAIKPSATLTIGALVAVAVIGLAALSAVLAVIAVIAEIHRTHRVQHEPGEVPRRQPLTHVRRMSRR